MMVARSNSESLPFGEPFIVDFPMKHGGSFHSYVSSPEGNSPICSDIVGYIYNIIPLIFH